MIRVIIERWVPHELAPLYNEHARKIMLLAMQQPGFISGETLHDLNNPGHRYTIATFRSLVDWRHWLDHPERIEMMSTMMPMLEHEEKVTLLEHSVEDA